MSVADVQFEFDLSYYSFKLKVKKLFCKRLVIWLVLRYFSCYKINKSFFQMNDLFSFQTHQNSDATDGSIRHTNYSSWLEIDLPTNHKYA